MGKMKDSSLLKWTQNNKNNKLAGSQEKKEKKSKKDEKNKKWLHTPENLTSGHIAYLVKFLGSTEVDQPKGIEVVKEGIRKLKFAQQIKKAEGTKTPKVELTVSVDGVAIQESKSKKILHQYPLHRISYCADDKAEKRFFSFIAKEADTEKHTCFVFVSDKLAEEITLTIGQAFDLAYKRFLSGKTESESEKIARLERENGQLRERLTEVGNLLGKTKLGEYLEKNNIKDLCVVGDRDQGDTDQGSESPSKDSSQDSSVEVEEGSVDSVTSPDKLINFDSITDAGLDTMTLDDLNDDDFDPRAFDQANSGDSSDTSDDFNPRGPLGGALQQPPVIKPLDNLTQAPAATVPARLAPPPALAPRDPSKVAGKPVTGVTPNPANTNPFSAPQNAGSNIYPSLPAAPRTNDPFGMTSFATGATAPKDPFSSAATFGNTADFSLDELDPLRK